MPKSVDDRIYILLSDLFLDTELTPTDHHDLADAIWAAQLSTDDIEHKIRAHLFPVLYPNLLGITGEWAGFDWDWLLREVSKARKRENDRFYKVWTNLLWFMFGGMFLASDWQHVKGLLQEKEKSESLKQEISSPPTP